MTGRASGHKGTRMVQAWRLADTPLNNNGVSKLDCVDALASIKSSQLGNSRRRRGQNIKQKCQPLLQKDNPSCPPSRGPRPFVRPAYPDDQVLGTGEGDPWSGVESDVRLDG